MIDIGFFYLLLLILLVFLLFIILLYSEGHMRTVIPSLLNSDYDLDGFGGDFANLTLVDNTGGLDIAGDAPTFEFSPLADDTYRDINGSLIIYGRARENLVSPNGRVELQIVDSANDNKVVSKGTVFEFYPGIGIQKFVLIFKASKTKNPKKFILRGKTLDNGTLTSGDIRVVSAYIQYF